RLREISVGTVSGNRIDPTDCQPWFPVKTMSPPVTAAISLIPLSTPLTRPNTAMSFNVVTKTHLPLPPIPLRPQGIAELLQHYPDKRFVDNLISIATHGARIGYEGPPVCPLVVLTTPPL